MNGRWSTYLPLIAAFRGSSGESTIRESSVVSPATKVGIQVLQAVLVGVALVVLTLGLFLMLNSVLNVFDVTRVDATVTSMGIVFVALSGAVVARLIFGTETAETVTNALAAVGILTAVALFVAVIFRSSGRLSWDMVVFVIGAGMFYAGALLVHNMTMQLLDPMGFTSPFERGMMSPLVNVLNAVADELLDDEDEESKQSLVVEVNIPSDNGRSAMKQIVDTERLKMTPEALKIFARAMIGGRSLTEGEWAKNRAVFPQGKNSFLFARSVMDDLGWIARDNPNVKNSTYHVTGLGLRVFERIAEL